MKTTYSAPITIFEGPDGGGKTTAAQAFAQLTSAKYVHLGAFSGVSRGLPRLYLEAMLPALLGHQPVVLDRCWLSERPYGDAFRDGKQRLSVMDVCMLERVSLRAASVVVRCLPSWEAVLDSFLRRKGVELLETEKQLYAVYRSYRDEWGTALPTVNFNYETMTTSALAGQIENVALTIEHPVNILSAGNWQADILLVGDSFGAHKDQDALQQYPFVSFSYEGCSRWLTAQLYDHKVSERRLLWVNADGGLAELIDRRSANPPMIVALGAKAEAALKTLGIKHLLAPHPQFWLRFNRGKPYPLLNYL